MSIAHLIEKIHIFPNFLQLQKQNPFPSEFFGAIAFYGNTVILRLSVGRAYIDRRQQARAVLLEYPRLRSARDAAAKSIWNTFVYVS